ncbi:MAG: OsmC family protein [Bacteriovoracaceae bacterium]
MESRLNWVSGMQFIAKNRGHEERFDVSREQGGDDSAPTPKEALLNAMCACSAMDVVSIAKKMRLEISRFWMEAKAEKTLTIPSYFASVHVKYYLEGQDLDREKVIRLVALSMTKYCGVSYMVSKATNITYDITLNGILIHEDKANFTLEVLT